MDAKFFPFLILLLLCSPGCESYLSRFTGKWKRPPRVQFHELEQIKFTHGPTIETIRSLRDRIMVNGNKTATLVNLIQVGDEWVSRCGNGDRIRNDISSNINFIASSQDYEKVAGCMANVLIKTSLIPKELSEDSQIKSTSIQIEGMADSRVAQGMLAVLSMVFASLEDPQDALTRINADDLSEYFGFGSLLPTGRLNGFFNMVKLIQEQIRNLSQLKEPGSGETEQQRLSVVGPTSITSAPNEADSTSVSIAYEEMMQLRKHEVAVLLSGGVDSSVALKLLLEQGYAVRAYYLKIWLEDEVAHLNECPWEEDLSYAQRVCDQLGVPLETVSLQKEYWQEVVQYTFDEARSGRTPNPDIMCNSRVKFGVFYDYVGRYHSKIATGHYAQVRPFTSSSSASSSVRAGFPTTTVTTAAGVSTAAATAATDNNDSANDITTNYKSNSSSSNHNIENHDQDQDQEVILVRSPDPVKDQSYFLCNLRQEQLRKCIFPIGHLQKYQVRELAEAFNLPTKTRKDSQGICFLGKLKFDDFISHYLGESPGKILDYRTHQEIGRHRGLWYHTIGQRKGIGPLLAPRTVHSGPWYVAGKDASSNTLYVTNELQIVQRPRRSFRVDNINWINSRLVPQDLFQPHNERQDKSYTSNTDAESAIDACSRTTSADDDEGGGGGSNGGVLMDMKLRHSPIIVRGTVRTCSPSTNIDSGTELLPTTGDAAESSIPAGIAMSSPNSNSSSSNHQDSPASAASLTLHPPPSSSPAPPSSVYVDLLQADKGIAPGQFAAFYLEDICIGAGVVGAIGTMDESNDMNLRSRSLDTSNGSTGSEHAAEDEDGGRHRRATESLVTELVE